jgi:hypothetical protein
MVAGRVDCPARRSRSSVHVGWWSLPGWRSPPVPVIGGTVDVVHLDLGRRLAATGVTWRLLLVEELRKALVWTSKAREGPR